MTSDRVMTAAHNIPAGTTELLIVTNTGTPLPAKIVGTDPQTDLALLSVADGDLQLAQFGGTSTPQVGQTVVAVSAGTHYRVGINVVSDRDVMVDAGTGVDVAGLLETGISVTPEMSGGALVDSDGNLVGVLTRATAGSPDGLAVPVSTVRDVARPARRQWQGHPRLDGRGVRQGSGRHPPAGWRGGADGDGRQPRGRSRVGAR